MEKIKTSISIDKDVSEKIKDFADKQDRSFSQQVNFILRKYIEEHISDTDK